VQTMQVVQCVAHHRPLDQVGISRFDPLGRELLLDERIVARIEHPYRYVRRVAFIARPRVRDLVQLDAAAHARNTFTVGGTASRSMSVECVMTLGVIWPL